MGITTAFITGTGFYTLPGIHTVEFRMVETPFGGVEVEIAEINGQNIAFIPRHGKQHSIPPSEVNYRANIFALKSLGVVRILATSVSGSLHVEWKPGTLVLIDQFINLTWGRKDTFYPLEGKTAYVDVTEPYCPTLHSYLLEAAHLLGISLLKGATYVCTQGPRFETRAEIEMIRRLGGDLVGQTNYPEVVLARELAICYATVGVISNWAAGIQPRVTAKEVMKNLEGVGEQLAHLFAEVIRKHPEPEDCTCRHVLDEASI
jgi:5'-methylthioadenosine phosphorylase